MFPVMRTFIAVPSPDLPSGLAAVPQPIEKAILAQRIHRFPETAVAIGRELTALDQLVHRFALEHDIPIAFKDVKELALEHEEAAVDRAAPRILLFVEGDNLIPIGFDGAETARRRHACDCSDLSVLHGELTKRVNIYVANPVTIGGHEIVGVDIGPAARDPLTGLSLTAGLDKGDRALGSPGLAKHIDTLGVAVHFETEIAVHQPLIQKVVLDLPTEVPKREDEVGESMAFVDLHYVPKHRLVAYAQQRLGDGIARDVRDPAAFTTAEDDYRRVFGEHRTGSPF